MTGITSLPASATEKFDEILAEATADPYTGLPRLAFLVTNKTGVLYEGYSGVMHLPPPPAVATSEAIKEQEKVGPKSIFDLWSCTKLVTVIATLQLADQGKLKLSDDASLYIKELRDTKHLVGFEEDGKTPIYKPKEESITVEQLVCHLSGFHLATDENPGRQIFTEPTATRESLTSISVRDPPGEKFTYGASNEYLALLIEDVSGQSLEDYYQSHIFKPLGITDISFNVNPNMMTPGIKVDGKFIFNKLPPFSAHQRFGGFGLNGSAPSYLKILRAILNGGTLDGATILKPETVDAFFVPRFTTDAQVQGIRDFLAGPLAEHPPSSIVGFDVNWCYGGLTNMSDLKTGRPKGSVTWSGLMNSYWVIDKKNELGFLVWGNTLPWSSKELHKAWEQLETRLYDAIKA